MEFDQKTLLLCIGAQKTGTTWLYQYLSSRSDVFMSPQKELHYFDDKYREDMDSRKILRRTLKRLRAQKKRKPRVRERIKSLRARLRFTDDSRTYRRYFERKVPQEVGFFGEITPSYALLPEAGYREIRDLFGKVRVIFIMRDPVDRFCSQIRHTLRSRDDVSQVQTIRDHLNDPFYLDRSRYDVTIKAVEAAFKKEEIVYLFYETMFADEPIREMCAHVGMEYVTPKFEQVVYATKTREEVPPDLLAQLRETLDPTYKFCRERFGDAIPERWRK